MWFWRDLTVSVKKASTIEGGHFELFACPRKLGPIVKIGDGDYSAGIREYDFKNQTTEQAIVFLLNISPNGREPVTLLYPWDLKGLAMFKEPVARPGFLDCADIRGQF